MTWATSPQPPPYTHTAPMPCPYQVRQDGCRILAEVLDQHVDSVLPPQQGSQASRLRTRGHCRAECDQV